MVSNELIYHFSGTSEVHFNDEILYCRQGTVRFLPGGKAEKYTVFRDNTCPDASTGSGCIDICFEADMPISEKAFVLHFAENKRLPELFKRIFAVWTAKNEGYYHESLSLLYALFAEIEKEKDYVSNRKFKQVEPVVEFLNTHFTEGPFSQKTILEHCHISYSYVKKLFGQKFGVSPEKYVLQLKLNYASDLLYTGYSITQTAELAGFCDVSYFSRQFKKTFGITPGQYKRKYISSK